MLFRRTSSNNISLFLITAWLLLVLPAVSETDESNLSDAFWILTHANFRKMAVKSEATPTSGNLDASLFKYTYRAVTAP